MRWRTGATSKPPATMPSFGTAASARTIMTSAAAMVAIGWNDAQGNLKAHSYDSVPPRTSISEMSHFIAQRDQEDIGLFVAPPYLSATGDRSLTAVCRRLTNPDGSFAGVVTAPIDQSYFNKLYRSVDLGNGGSISLMHIEGRLLAREPVRKEAIARSFTDAPSLLAHMREPFGSFESISPVDGVPRVVGYK
jgi:hypothetical protein